MKILHHPAHWLKITLLGICLGILLVTPPAAEQQNRPRGDTRPAVTASPDVTALRRVHIHRATYDYPALIADLQAIASRQSPLLLSQISTSSIADLYREIALLLAATNPNAAPEYLTHAIKLDPALRTTLRPLQRAIYLNSDTDPAYLLTTSGRELAALGEWHLAEAAFQNAISANPSYAEAWAYLGEARQHSNSNADPYTALETALKLNPESVAAHSFLSFYWQRQNDLETALEYARNAATLAPGTPELLMRLGDLTALSGDLAAGQEIYLQAIAANPDNPDSLRALIAFNLRYGFDLRNAALPLARQLVIASPRSPESLDLMGEVLLRLGDLANAERFFFRSLAQDPNFAQAHLHLGDLYWLQGEIQPAAAHYRRALALSHNEAVILRIKTALDEMGVP